MDVSMINILFDVAFVGWILFVGGGGICLRIIFRSKMTKKIIDELNKNLYTDVADSIQELFDYRGLWHGIFTKRSRLEWKAIKLFSKLTVPPDQTKLCFYQRFLKISLFVSMLGLAMFFISFILLRIF